jgi:hypothetical protein
VEAAVPPAPVQVSVYWSIYKLAPLCEVTSVPLVATAPFHAQLPLAVHEVAFVLDQASVELLPELIVDGVRVIETVGAGVAARAMCVPPGIT